MTEADKKMLELTRLRHTDPRYNAQVRKQYMEDIKPYKKALEDKGIPWTEDWQTKWCNKTLTMEEMNALDDADFKKYYAIVQTRKMKEQMYQDKVRREAAEKEAARKRMMQDKRDFAALDAMVIEAEAEAKAAASLPQTDFGLY